MTTMRKIIGLGVAATLMLVDINTGAWGQVPAGGGGSFGGGGREVIQLKGTVLCAGCSLDEVRKTQPNGHHLYQLTHRRGQVVMQVNEVNNPRRWSDLSWPPRIRVRAKDSVFQQLSAEENLLKEVEISGLLSNTRALDIFTVAIRG